VWVTPLRGSRHDDCILRESRALAP
jgi:hypothetical protein